MDPKKDLRETPAPGAAGFDPLAYERIRDILRQLGNTVSAMKIFPSDHASAKAFIDDLTEKLRSFLDNYGKLEISIEEHSFSWEGREAYKDEMTIKSLPFFFFKDGMQTLFFYQGLDREEIVGFLNLIRSESQKPAEDSDIVTGMWERDFANIHYFAPDDFLESRIIEERQESLSRLGLQAPADFAHEVIEVRVDTSKFSSGRILLTDEDKEEIRKGPAIRELEGGEPSPAGPVGEAGGDEGRETGRSPAAALDPGLTESELRNLEFMVRANRTISPRQEFLNLMVEILFLEKDRAKFSGNLDVLLDFHLQQLDQGDFSASIHLVRRIRDLQDHLASTDPEKAGRLGEFLKEVVSERTVQAARTLISGKQAVDLDALMGFLKALGAPALTLAAGIFDSLPDPGERSKILDFIATRGVDDLPFLVSLAGEERPLLTKEIIRILARTRTRRGVPHLSVFLGFQNKDIKLEAVRALSEVKDEMANRILLGFLNDRDEDVRIQAALGLNPAEEMSRIRHLIREASAKAFKDKSLKEKRVIFSFLGLTRTPEAVAFLIRTVKKGGIFSGKRARETRLGAVAGLESAATPESVAALEKAARTGDRAVRQASSEALLRLAAGRNPK